MKRVRLLFTFLLLMGLLIPLRMVPGAKASAGSDTKVGVYLFVWYGNEDGTGGLGTRHWNDSAAGIVVDEPVIGYYSSCNVTAVRWQVRKMAEAGIDFVLISWWGPTSYEDNGTRTFLEADAEEGWLIEFAIFVEPYEDPLNYSAIYTYVNDTFVTPYPDHYFKRDVKPLLVFFNPAQPTETELFEVHVTGDCGPEESWEDWPQWVAQGGEIFNLSGSDGIYPPWFESEYHRTSSDGMISVIPRFDDYSRYKAGGKDWYMRFDENYTESLHDRQWRWALAEECTGYADLIMIYGWNEYHERVAVEPHTDLSGADPYLAYNGTKKYIQRLRRRSAFVVNETGVSGSTWSGKQLQVNFSTPGNIEVFCSLHGAPKYVEGGSLVSYNTTFKRALIKVNESEITVSWNPRPTPNFYAWGAIGAAGAGFAYLLYRRRR